MALTRDFKETIRARVERDPKFRKELLREGVEAMVAGDVATAKTILRDFINATVGFTELSEETHIPSKSLMRMLGPSGNPRADNLLQIVRLLQRARVCVFRSKPRRYKGAAPLTRGQASAPRSPDSGVLFSTAPCRLMLYSLVRVRLPDRGYATCPRTRQGIVVGMLIGRKIAKRNVIVSSLLDLAGTRDSDAVTVKQQPRHEHWMVRCQTSPITPFIASARMLRPQRLDQGPSGTKCRSSRGFKRPLCLRLLICEAAIFACALRLHPARENHRSISKTPP